eukprot:4365041-Alexandrium_andersonii.AAC.1
MYAPPGRTPYWEAKLPPGVLLEGRKSCSPTFGPRTRTEADAKALALAFLRRAVDAGLVPPAEPAADS